VINHPCLDSQPLVPITVLTSMTNAGMERFGKPCTGSHRTGSACHGFEFPPRQDGDLNAEQAGLASKMGGGMGP
jgi:hypothetical protein